MKVSKPPLVIMRTRCISGFWFPWRNIRPSRWGDVSGTPGALPSMTCWRHDSNITRTTTINQLHDRQTSPHLRSLLTVSHTESYRSAWGF